MAGRGQLGTLRVGMVGSAVIGLLPALMRAFTERYPRARLELTEAPSGLHHTEAIRERRIDIGLIRYPPPTAPEVAVELVLEEPLIAVLPKGHPLASQAVITTSALREEPFVLWPSWRSPRLYEETYSEAGSLGFSPQIAQEANGIQPTLALVAAGAGVSLLPASVRALQREGVAFRELAEPAPTTKLAAAWHRDNRSPLLGRFLELVHETLSTTGTTSARTITDRTTPGRHQTRRPEAVTCPLWRKPLRRATRSTSPSSGSAHDTFASSAGSRCLSSRDGRA